VEVNLKSVRVRLPEADGHAAGAGEAFPASQQNQFLQPLLHTAASWQLALTNLHNVHFDLFLKYSSCRNIQG
jgi:hypothetical protein